MDYSDVLIKIPDTGESGDTERDDDGIDNRPEGLDSPLGIDGGLLHADNIMAASDNTSVDRISVASDAGPIRHPTIFVNGVELDDPSVNAYQHKKTLAQGMMDLALLSANANQLRYVLELQETHPYFYQSVVLISISILFQVAVGIGLIVNSRYNIEEDEDRYKANRINNLTLIAVLFVTVVNVFISSFGVAGGSS